MRPIRRGHQRVQAADLEDAQAERRGAGVHHLHLPDTNRARAPTVDNRAHSPHDPEPLARRRCRVLRQRRDGPVPAWRVRCSLSNGTFEVELTSASVQRHRSRCSLPIVPVTAAQAELEPATLARVDSPHVVARGPVVAACDRESPSADRQVCHALWRLLGRPEREPEGRRGRRGARAEPARAARGEGRRLGRARRVEEDQGQGKGQDGRNGGRAGRARRLRRRAKPRHARQSVPQPAGHERSLHRRTRELLDHLPRRLLPSGALLVCCPSHQLAHACRPAAAPQDPDGRDPPRAQHRPPLCRVPRVLRQAFQLQRGRHLAPRPRRLLQQARQGLVPAEPAVPTQHRGPERPLCVLPCGLLRASIADL